MLALSFLARKDEVKCLHSLLIIMGYFLGQHNPSNYFALTIEVPKYLDTFHKYIPYDYLKVQYSSTCT